MKALLISIAMVIATISAFGQQKATSATQSTKPQSDQHSNKTESAQVQKASPQEKQVSTTNKANDADKKINPGTNKKIHPKDSLSYNEHKKPIHKESEQKKADVVEHWQCPKCGRIYTHLPPKGQCLDDDITLVQIK